LSLLNNSKNSKNKWLMGVIKLLFYTAISTNILLQKKMSNDIYRQKTGGLRDLATTLYGEIPKKLKNQRDRYVYDGTLFRKLSGHHILCLPSKSQESI